MCTRSIVALACLFALVDNSGGYLVAVARGEAGDRPKVFRAGAYAIDITPTKFPVVVNGMFNERTANAAHDKLHARCLVLDDGTAPLAIVVVDSLMLPREFLDEAKQLAAQATGIPAQRMLISATHTHSAPSVMGCLGSGVDPNYPGQLMPQIARGIELAAKNLTPAQAGWTVVQDFEHTKCRRWLRRPDAIGADPFGESTIRAMMHPGYQNSSYVGPAGPVDPDLSLLSIQTTAGQPLAVLANFSMHYFGSPLVSADYFGAFCEKLEARCKASSATNGPAFVAILSQGTSGDAQWMDYAQPQQPLSLDQYAQQVADVALKAYEKITYRQDITLAMAETKLKLGRRVPNAARLAWARDVIQKLEGRPPTTHPEIYAHEAISLHEQPERELILQAVRIGDLGIATFPNEVFGITGLKTKLQSPLAHTFNIALANGAEGYIPPPEQHALGGYTTWPARTAGLEVEAEPKIVEALLKLLEQVAAKPRRERTISSPDYATAVLASQPLAYARLDDLSGQPQDATAHKTVFHLEPGVALYLEGPPLQAKASDPKALLNRAPQFAGGRLAAHPEKLGLTYSAEFWFENRLPCELRPVTAYLFSRGPAGHKECPGDHLGLMGSHVPGDAGRLVFFTGNERNEVLTGKTRMEPYTWNHVVLVREGARVRVYLNGQRTPEIDADCAPTIDANERQLFFGGRSDNFANLAGRLDEAALYDRALTADEIAAHFTSAGLERVKP